ncbi:hypothetical protein N8603_05890 [Verrucomicrobiales bacterium]|nr:hypothetical protein [Verrucomicrobiales bacterium]
MTTNHKNLSAAFILLFYSLPTLLAETYTQDFNGFDNGTVDLNDGSVITGEAARILDGRLQLTRDGEGLGFFQAFLSLQLKVHQTGSA